MSTRMTILCMMTIALTGCEPKTPTEKLVGKWNLDAACTLQADPETVGLSPPVMQKLANFVTPLFQTFFFIFDRDGKLTVKRNHVEEHFDYTVAHSNQVDALTLSLKQPLTASTVNAPTRFEDGFLKVSLDATTYCLVEF
ncbi:MAG: hypothetical protein ACPGQS_08480 [Bradymonadia bacterium]